jgi:hypothetical protein
MLTNETARNGNQRARNKTESAKGGEFFLCLQGKYNIMQGAKLLKIASSQMWPIRHDWQLSKY